jgi:tRNA (cmo5U34)-methyltransferase
LPHFPRTHFILADPSAAMLEQARKRLQNAPPERVQFLPPLASGDLASTHCPAPQVVTAIMSHHYLQPEGRNAAIRACYQVLAEKGIFITFENIDSSSPEGSQIALERWKRYQREQGRPLAAVEEHGKRFKTQYFPISVEAHCRLLTAVGFAVAEIFWFSQMQAGFYAIKGNCLPIFT